VPPPRKTNVKPKPDPVRDRLTATIWPPKVEGTGVGVRFAFYLALALCGLTLANLLVFALLR
jgi:hypothetical protein